MSLPSAVFTAYHAGVALVHSCNAQSHTFVPHFTICVSHASCSDGVHKIAFGNQCHISSAPCSAVAHACKGIVARLAKVPVIGFSVIPP